MVLTDCSGLTFLLLAVWDEVWYSCWQKAAPVWGMRSMMKMITLDRFESLVGFCSVCSPSYFNCCLQVTADPKFSFTLAPQCTPKQQKTNLTMTNQQHTWLPVVTETDIMAVQIWFACRDLKKKKKWQCVTVQISQEKNLHDYLLSRDVV